MMDYMTVKEEKVGHHSTKNRLFVCCGRIPGTAKMVMI